MIASLLPGLRELRTPLVVGWTWLVAIRVALGDYLPGRDSSSGLVRETYKLVDLLGTAAIGVAAFLAYLIGSLVVRRCVLNSRLDRFFGRRGSVAGFTIASGTSTVALLISDFVTDKSEELNSRLERISFTPSAWSLFNFLDADSYRSESRSKPESTPGKMDMLVRLDYVPDPRNIVRAILDQRTQLETRLLTEKRDVYDYYDRLDESAELRSNLAAAVFGLGAACFLRLKLEGQGLWQLLALSVLTLAISLALQYKSRQQFHRARQALATAVVIGLIKSPRIEAWEKEVAKVEELLKARSENDNPPQISS